MKEKDFEILFRETKGVVLSAVRRYLPCDFHYAIDDVVQETYIRVINSIESISFESEKQKKNFVYTVAKNESLRMAKKMGREIVKIRELQSVFTEEYDDILTGESDDSQILREAISKMPDIHRDIFLLMINGRSEEEISKKLSINKGTIKSRIHRGKVILYNILKEAEYEAN